MHRAPEHVGRQDRVPAFVDLYGAGALGAFAFLDAAGPAAEERALGVAQRDGDVRGALERRLYLHGGDSAARLEVSDLALAPIEHELVEVVLGPKPDLLEFAAIAGG